MASDRPWFGAAAWRRLRDLGPAARRERERAFARLARDCELMFDLPGVGIAFVRDDRIQRANAALADLVGCRADELAGVRLADLFAQAAPEADGGWRGERPLHCRDGRVLWVQASQRAVVAGEPGGESIASFVNVDARHRAEHAVARQAERTRAILDSALVGIVTVGAQGIEWMNRSARRMFGGDLATFVNLPISTVATADPDHPLLRSDAWGELIEGETETFECRLQARDGRQFWVVGNVVSTARDAGDRQLTYALLDIERRRDAEARMSQARAQLQRIIEAAPLAIALRDAQSLRVLQVNAVAAANAHDAPGGLIGCTPEETHAPEVAAQQRADMQHALAASEVTTREYRVERDGAVRLWDTRYLPLASHPGAPPDQLLTVATDVTEQRAAQEARLAAAIEQREMLVREVHHRIKNNLQGVAGLLEQIAQRKPEVAEPIAEVVGQVHAIAQVYGLQVGQGGPLQLTRVVEAIVASVQRTFGRSIRVEAGGATVAHWALPEAEAIPIALTLNELLTNAIKHCAPSAGAGLACALTASDDVLQVVISNPATLAPGFSLARVPGGVSGLGLVRALLPRRSAHLTLEQRAERVVATLALRPPCIVSTNYQ
jgi:PAS domain S-box-containing protein